MCYRARSRQRLRQGNEIRNFNGLRLDQRRRGRAGRERDQGTERQGQFRGKTHMQDSSVGFRVLTEKRPSDSEVPGLSELLYQLRLPHRNAPDPAGMSGTLELIEAQRWLECHFGWQLPLYAVRFLWSAFPNGTVQAWRDQAARRAPKGGWPRTEAVPGETKST
jgi:hypothetical protein